MSTIDIICSRRSIRRYQSRPVPEEDVRRLLKAAMSAPSSGDGRPWHYVVITDKETRKQLTTVHPYSHMLTEAPVAILVCGDRRLARYDGIYLPQECAAATQNLLLAAHGEGLGAVWLSVYPLAERIDGIRGILSIPEHVIPFSLIAIGYPAEHKAYEDRYDASRVHLNAW